MGWVMRGAVLIQLMRHNGSSPKIDRWPTGSGLKLEENDYWDDESEDAPEDDMEKCPSCHQWIYEDSEQCPLCGYYLTDSEMGQKRPSMLFVLTIALLLVIVFGWTCMTF